MSPPPGALNPKAVSALHPRHTVRVSPDPFLRARGLKHSLWRLLPAGRARWRPRRSLGAS
eukprot:4264782-Prymnesium_polylepis.1